MGLFRCGSQTFEIKKREIADLYEKHLNRTLANFAIDAPVEEDDRCNPHVVMDTLARTWTEMSEWWAKNAMYYASGKCGGCEICGLPPRPDITTEDWRQVRRAIKMALEEIEKMEARPNAEDGARE